MKKSLWLKYGVSITLFLIFLEILLRVTNVFQTNGEENGGSYNYKYYTHNKSWFHTWNPNDSLLYKNSEFAYHNYYNDLGHRELDFSTFNMPSSEKKIVYLGDSFTEGDGAPIDSTWTKSFDLKLKEDTSEIYRSYNAGVCGSDVFFNYIMLKEKLLVSQPKVVIEAVNGSDILDIFYYGGSDRFKENEKMLSTKHLSWEPLYAYSHVFRLFIYAFTDYDLSLINNKTWDKDMQDAVQLLVKQIKETNRLCMENDIDYHVVLMPTPTEIAFDRDTIFEGIFEQLNDSISVLNVYPCMFEKLDTTSIFNYFWVENRHYNSRGYALLGNCIYDSYINKK